MNLTDLIAHELEALRTARDADAPVFRVLKKLKKAEHKRLETHQQQQADEARHG